MSLAAVGMKCHLHMIGPQTYNASRGMAAESLYKAYVASTLHGAFGSTAARRGLSLSRDEREHPGPAHYQSPTAAPCSTGPPRGRIIRASSNFASQSLRIKKPEHLVRARQPSLLLLWTLVQRCVI